MVTWKKLETDRRLRLEEETRDGDRRGAEPRSKRYIRIIYKEKEGLTLTATTSYDVLQEGVLGGYQAPAPPWHPFFVEWSRILVAAMAIRISASLRRLERSQADRDTWHTTCGSSCVCKIFLLSLSRLLSLSHGITPLACTHLSRKNDGTPHATVRNVVVRTRVCRRLAIATHFIGLGSRS